MPSLYELTNETKTLQDKLIESLTEDGEVDGIVAEALICKGEEFDQKAISVATVYRNFLYEIDKFDKEIRRLSEMKGKLTRLKDSLKTNLEKSCQLVGKTEIKGLSANISFRKSTETEVYDFDKLPEEFKTAKVTYSADKTKIKKAIQQGANIEGARLIEKNNIQIE